MIIEAYCLSRILIKDRLQVGAHRVPFPRSAVSSIDVQSRIAALFDHQRPRLEEGDYTFLLSQGTREENLAPGPISNIHTRLWLNGVVNDTEWDWGESE